MHFGDNRCVRTSNNIDTGSGGTLGTHQSVRSLCRLITFVQDCLWNSQRSSLFLHNHFQVTRVFAAYIMGEGSVSWISLLTRFLGRWKLSRKIQAPSGILHNYEVFKAIDANQSYHTEALKCFCYHLVTSFCEVNCSWEIMHLTLDSKGAQLCTVLWRSCTCRVRGGTAYYWQRVSNGSATGQHFEP